MAAKDFLDEIRADPELGGIYEEARAALESAADSEALEGVRVAYLGRKGRLSVLLQGIKRLEPEEKRRVGRLGNLLKGWLEKALADKGGLLRIGEMEEALRREEVDITLPGRAFPAGTRHLLSSIIEEIEDIFIGMGYRLVEGPEVELDYYNFEALNIPASHPARDPLENFYLSTARVVAGDAVKGDTTAGDAPLLLRSQTSRASVLPAASSSAMAGFWATAAS